MSIYIHIFICRFRHLYFLIHISLFSLSLFCSFATVFCLAMFSFFLSCSLSLFFSLSLSLLSAQGRKATRGCLLVSCLAAWGRGEEHGGCSTRVCAGLRNSWTRAWVRVTTRATARGRGGGSRRGQSWVYLVSTPCVGVGYTPCMIEWQWCWWCPLSTSVSDASTDGTCESDQISRVGDLSDVSVCVSRERGVVSGRRKWKALFPRSQCR